MVVSYPMYNLPEMQQSLQIWWSVVRSRLNEQGIEAPETLSKPQGDLFEYWLRPDLLLSQTCGFPLVSHLQSQVKLIGTPVFSEQGCIGPNYCSFYIVQADDPRDSVREFQGLRFTYNGTDSQSGFNAVRVNLLENDFALPFFGENILSGGHRQSILNVGQGLADICAVDCVTHSLLKQHQPEVLTNTRILTGTKKTPGLPLITSVHTNDQTVDALFGAIKDVCEDESMRSVNDDLLLTDIKRVELESYYKAISQPETPIEKL